jgi:hypothetical protein
MKMHLERLFAGGARVLLAASNSKGARAVNHCPIVVPVDAQVMKVDVDAQTFYSDVLHRLRDAKIPFLLGGAFALSQYAGVARDTKDLDVFICREQWEPIADLVARAGYEVELTFPHWLGKVKHGERFVDVIFNSGNGLTPVDATWHLHARDGEVLGVPVKLCPPEESIWSKCFIMERERFDGADVAHFFRACAETLDWRRLLDRFGPRWRVLMSHLVLFGFIYPGERHKIPRWVMLELTGRLAVELERPDPEDTRCQGTLVSRAQYLVDVECWGYADARLEPEGGGMSEGEVAVWTEAINKVE